MISRKEAAAKGIRILSVPPVMITALVLVLAALRSDMYRNNAEIVVTIVLLGFTPVLAYPVHQAVPALRAKGREGQRTCKQFYGTAAVSRFSDRGKTGDSLCADCRIGHMVEPDVKTPYNQRVDRRDRDLYGFVFDLSSWHITLENRSSE